MDTIQGYLSYYYFEWERWVEDYCSFTQAETRAQISKGEISALVRLALLAEAENMEWWWLHGKAVLASTCKY